MFRFWRSPTQPSGLREEAGGRGQWTVGKRRQAAL